MVKTMSVDLTLKYDDYFLIELDQKYKPWSNIGSFAGENSKSRLQSVDEPTVSNSMSGESVRSCMSGLHTAWSYYQMVPSFIIYITVIETKTNKLAFISIS